MKYQSFKVWIFVECLINHSSGLIEIRRGGYVIGNDGAVVHVHDRREIQFAFRSFELGDIGCPFLIGSGCIEISYVSCLMIIFIDLFMK